MNALDGLSDRPQLLQDLFALLGGDEPVGQPLESGGAAVVVRILPVEQRDQRPRVDQDYRESFLRMARVTPVRTSVEGARASPPGHRSSVL